MRPSEFALLKPLTGAFSFAVFQEKTKTKKNSYAPEWNEEIVFTEMFPPLCNRIRISVCDWDAVYNECIATHFMDLNQIMNEGENGVCVCVCVVVIGKNAVPIFSLGKHAL